MRAHESSARQANRSAGFASWLAGRLKLLERSNGDAGEAKASPLATFPTGWLVAIRSRLLCLGLQVALVAAAAASPSRADKLLAGEFGRQLGTRAKSRQIERASWLAAGELSAPQV